MSIKNRSKPLTQTSPRKTTNENLHTPVCRSRSIDSMSANEQVIESNSSGGGGGGDDKPQSTVTFAKTFRTLRKRISRTSNSNKQETRRRSQQIDNLAKSGGDDSGASSTGEEGTQFVFTDIPTSNSDLTTIESSTAKSLKVHRSLPSEKTPAIITSPPPPSSDSNEKNYERESSSENSNLSKTWSGPTFTGAQLRGTCSLEYTEHMKDKSHKRKAHMIDLRKDDVQQQIQQLSPNTITSTSKTSISTAFTSYHSHTLTLFDNKGALT
jgi:hypothetical protein